MPWVFQSLPRGHPHYEEACAQPSNTGAVGFRRAMSAYAEGAEMHLIRIALQQYC